MINRRQFIIGAITSSAGIVVGGGVIWSRIEPYPLPLTIEQVVVQLNQLMTSSLQTTGAWDLAEIFNHCAQSIEYSMLGYPQLKSPVFQNTIGRIAFASFEAKGKMTHDLAEAIPGAPMLLKAQNSQQAYQRLQQALSAFNAYQGELAPQFAYGYLTKQQYEAAHVMHINNHLSEIAIKQVG
ncbi:DUF1569 domain-containing protein [Shewanella aestuarii]|uniref:DUF1569 domain-containing protein n=1 Tax=Shewanella aestuarii TaxID=1028752 RepID=A0A6G9QI78_9GAMM|nr:DUF1569 domain-containing protein [Shewanella aestuarii]QIR14108.1 DUF1569 domain-containing protein [Shewanella aestuarii]